MKNTATHPAFTIGLTCRETVYSSAQSFHRGRRESPAQVSEWSVSINIQLVTKPVQGFSVFQPDSPIVNLLVSCVQGSSYRRGSVAVSQWAESIPDVS